MNPLTYQDVRRILSSIDEAQPLLDLALGHSSPNPARAWAGSALVDTIADREVDLESLRRAASSMTEEEVRHAARTQEALLEVVEALAQGDPQGAATLLLRAASWEEERSRWGRALAYAQAAADVLVGKSAIEPAARAHRRAGRYAKALGRLPEAERFYRRGEEFAEARGDLRGAAEGAVGAGNVLEAQGLWDRAAESYQRALDLLDSLEGPVPERWHAQINLHLVLRSQGRIEESKPWLERARDEAERLGDPGFRPFGLTAEGQMAMWEGRMGTAENAFREALAEAGSPAARVTIRLKLAECLLAQARLAEAMDQCREAEREAVAGHVVAKLPETYRLLGRTVARSGSGEAFVLFERALELIDERDLPPLERALTLQAYAQVEEEGAAQVDTAALLEEAQRILTDLGIEHLRHPWVDVYASPGRINERSEGSSTRYE